MVTYIKSGESNNISTLRFQTIKLKKFNAKKYLGVIKKVADPLKIQRNLRNDWE